MQRPRATPASAATHLSNPQPKDKIQQGEWVKPGAVLSMESPRLYSTDPGAAVKKAWDSEGEGGEAALPVGVGYAGTVWSMWEWRLFDEKVLCGFPGKELACIGSRLDEE
eukprot:1161292-Pelagomonas_calceolata.AAC.2